MLDVGRSRAEAAGVDNVTFEQATIEQITTPAESLDMVLGMSILHLLEDKEAAIAEVQRLLKPGGLFVTSTVCLEGTMRWFKPIFFIGNKLSLLPLVMMFTADELAASIAAAGFEIEYRWQPDKGEALFLVARKAEAVTLKA